MGVRKNVKYLDDTEIENFVRACVLVKADIVNPGAPANEQYSKWDEFVAIHRMIQNAFAPGSASVNFGHGGSGAYSFLSWHRYFLYQFELELQSHVPGVMLPYWDFTDLSSVLTENFLGPDGDAGTEIVSTGYFAEDAPGTGANSTTAPAWWPAGLVGWRLPDAFPVAWRGGLRRNIGGALPTVTDIQEVLNMSTFPDFQNALESGAGLSGSTMMHNSMHGYIDGHMGNATASPFDPIFYLLHANVDRLWAMWQMDGHETTYPVMGGSTHHHRDDLMYPWTGGAAGYGTNISMAPIGMPDFSALGPQTNGDTLDHRAMGYTYDTMPVLGVSLDRTGSMNQMTPDPMTSMAPDVTKWEAATRGVSALLQDCEAAYENKEAYVFAGVETFRTTGGSHQFTPVFGAADPSGLIKASGSHSQSSFDTAIATLSPGGGTPLAEALTHADTNLVKAPFSDIPADERRYLAILTDGMLTTGPALSTIPAGGLGDTAVFAMGFGTGADVDYPTLDTMVSKGVDVPDTTQVFHGENEGTIDKFYTDSLAAAIGYVPMVDPVLELFAGEHTHIDFYVTSAEDRLFISAQGIDFSDSNWTYHLIAPDGSMVYMNKPGGHTNHAHCAHKSAKTGGKYSNGRLSLFVQRDGAADAAWIGKWQLMVAYKAPNMAHMVMQPAGALLAPVSAGPVLGPRYFRERDKHGKRSAVRLLSRTNTHGFDIAPPFTSADKSDASNVTVNIYARTRLKFSLEADTQKGFLQFTPRVNGGHLAHVQAFGRLFSPRVNMKDVFKGNLPGAITRGASLRSSRSLKFDSAVILSKLEKQDPERFRYIDSELVFDLEKHGVGIAKLESCKAEGIQHVGVLIRGVYHPNTGEVSGGHHGGKSDSKTQRPQKFERILNYTFQ